MKVLGVGIDLVSNTRVRSYISLSYTERFLKKFLHPEQLETFFNFGNDQAQVEFVASRWAVKQAISKAIGRKQLDYNEMRVVKDALGKPYIKIEGEQNQILLNELGIDRCLITITHEEDYTMGYAIAFQK